MALVGAMAVAGMRGLNLFIQDIRNAANKEVEQARVDKELANIRTKFKNAKTMTAYDKKKCVPALALMSKLVFEATGVRERGGLCLPRRIRAPCGAVRLDRVGR